MGGRLGNQLFRYATARYVQETMGGELVLDYTQVYKQGSSSPSEIGFEDSLRHFHTQPYQLDSSVALTRGSLVQRILFIISMILIRTRCNHTRLFDKINKLCARHGLYISTGGVSYCPIVSTGARNKFVYGRFEDIRYFDEIREYLLDELVPRHEERIENMFLYDILKSDAQTVCISIRRGDYVSNPINATLNICTREYFEKAVCYIKEHVTEPVFIVFSDDIAWCRGNIDFIDADRCFFETGDDPVWEKLRLMYMCKHFIISNSTFSWWAQYLSRYDGKIVVAPDRWFATEDGDRYPLLLDSFVRVRGVTYQNK